MTISYRVCVLILLKVVGSGGSWIKHDSLNPEVQEYEEVVDDLSSVEELLGLLTSWLVIMKP